MEERELIQKAGELLIKYGIKSMTMDDISRQLGISKKTLYQFVDNKKDLVKKVVQAQISFERECACKVFDSPGNAIDQLMSITEFVGSQMKEIHPSVMFDLKKYHMEAWKCIKDHKEQFIYKNIKENLETGVKEGLYRENMDTELVARFYLSMVNTILDPESVQLLEVPKEKIYKEMMRYHIRGIASHEGRDYLKTKFNQNHV